MIVQEVPSEDLRPLVLRLLTLARRRRYVLVLPVFAGLAIGALGYASAPWSYVSEAVLALDVRRIQALPSESVVSPLPQESPVLRTELDIIGSRMMAGKVLRLLEERGVPVQVEQPEISLISRLWDLTAGHFFQAVASPLPDAPPQVRARDPEETRARIDHLLGNLRVNNDGRSFTIFISFRASDPAYAAQVANAYGRAYLDHQVDVQQSVTRRVSDWLGEKLVSLRAELESSERAIKDFRETAGITETDGTTLQAQRVSALNTELVTARAQLAGSQARLETVNSLARTDDPPALAEIIGSTTIQTLRADKARLERQLESLRDSGALKSGQIRGLTSELSSLRQQIDRETRQVIQSLSNEIAIGRNKEASLAVALVQAQRDLSEASHAEVRLAQLEREANANRTIYESYLARYKQTIEQDGIVTAEVQLISAAEPALARASPRLSTWLLFGLALGGGAAVAGVALREATDRRTRLLRSLEASAGLPVIGSMPKLTRFQRRHQARDAQDAASPFGRALGSVRAVLSVAPGLGAGPAVVLTSAQPGEGKTMLAVGLARSAAAAGMRVVVIDADLRRPELAGALATVPTIFLDQVLDMQKPAATLLQKDASSEARFLAARPSATRPEALLSGPRFRELVTGLKQSFDLILIDTPDLSTAPDALQVAMAADQVVLVARFDTGELDQVVAAARSLAACERQPEGIVLNRVERRADADVAARLRPRVRVAPRVGGNPRLL